MGSARQCVQADSLSVGVINQSGRAMTQHKQTHWLLYVLLCIKKKKEKT